MVFITRFVVNPERVELIDETRRGTTQKIPDIHDNTSVNILSKYFSDNAAHCGEFGECLICDASELRDVGRSENPSGQVVMLWA